MPNRPALPPEFGRLDPPLAHLASWFQFPAFGNALPMSNSKHHAEVLDPEQEDDEQPTELPPEEEPLTASEPDTLPPDPDLTPPDE